MRQHPGLAVGLVLIAILTGCASGPGEGGPVSPGDSTPAASVAEDAAADAQAQAWLDAAALPPGAVRATGGGGFTSYTGWPCRPVAELEAYWTIADMTVAETVEWLRANPTADLVSTAAGPVPVDPSITAATIGYIPADDSQQGVVYTVRQTGQGVAVRAEVAALTASATCPSLAPGEMLGKPGQG